MANPVGIFFSRLAPEDKKFIKRIGFLLVILLLSTVAALFAYKKFAKVEIFKATVAEKPKKEETFELPPLPELPEMPEESTELSEPEEAAETEESGSDNNSDEYFDENAHLELMRQNASKYNFKLAYKHGARITRFLRSSPELTAEWGHVLLEAGKPEDAASALQSAISKGLNKTEVLFYLTVAMLRSGQALEAIALVDEHLKENNDIDLLASKAALLMEAPDTNMRKEANEIFLKIAGKKSHVADYLYARFLMQNGDYQKSKTYLELAVKAEPKNPRYIARLGMAEFYLKRDASAEAMYKKTLSINPYDYNTWFNLGELYYSKANESGDASDIRQKTNQAMEAYLKAIANNPQHINAHYRVGLLQNLNGAHKEAIKHLKITLEKRPNHIPSMLQLSSAYLQLGDTTQSVNYLNTVLQIDPFNKVAASEKRRIEKR